MPPRERDEMYEVRFRAFVDKTGLAVGRVTEDRAARDTLDSVRLVTTCLAGPSIVQAPLATSPGCERGAFLFASINNVGPFVFGGI